jgi:hypothetical protein
MRKKRMGLKEWGGGDTQPNKIARYCKCSTLGFGIFGMGTPKIFQFRSPAKDGMLIQFVLPIVPLTNFLNNINQERLPPKMKWVLDLL